MLVDREGTFLSQRKLPRMALIEPRPQGDGLRVTAPGMEPLVVAAPGGGRRPVGIWKDRCDALDAGTEAARWFSGFLGVDCSLVRQADDEARLVDADFTGGVENPHVSFVDGFPLLLTSTESLADLNRRMARTVPMDRFRPNVVVSGAPAWAEDRWRQVRIGSVAFAVVKPCARCAITTVDQATGEKGSEPLRTLGTFRRGDGGVLFGQNLVHRARGTLEVGDPVVVEARRPIRN
jgi:uncharacterized protein